MKNNFLKSTLILLIGGAITKVLGLLIKIIYTRILKEDGITLYSIVMPTYSLLLSVASFNIQLAVSKRISAKQRAKKVLVNSCYIMFVLNAILIITILFSAHFISNTLLKMPDAYFPIVACTFTLPFVSIGYIIKGYFYGKQNMAPHMISNVLEQLFRLGIILLLLPYVSKYGTVVTVTTLIGFSVLSESFSLFIFYIFLPKHIQITKKDLLYNKTESKELLAISVPSISGRLLGNVAYFFEPILLTNLLVFMELDKTFITTQYGIYNLYAVSTLLFPSFFITAISNALLPEISRLYEEKKKTLLKKRVRQALLISFVVGILCTSIIYFFKEPLLYLLYHTKEGTNYIATLAPFFVLFYLESPLSSILIGLNKVKTCTFISLSGIFLKLLCLAILCLLGCGIYSLVIAEIMNIIYVTCCNALFLKKELNCIG